LNFKLPTNPVPHEQFLRLERTGKSDFDIFEHQTNPVPHERLLRFEGTGLVLASNLL